MGSRNSRTTHCLLDRALLVQCRPLMASFPSQPQHSCTPGLHQAPEEKETAESTTAPNFQRKIVFPSPRKSLSEKGLKQKSVTERLSRSSQTHYSRCSRCNTGSQHSTAGPTHEVCQQQDSACSPGHCPARFHIPVLRISR